MIFEKWEKEVLPGRRCEKWERLKLNNIKKFPGFKAKLIDNPQRAIREYRDYRLFHKTINPNGISGDSVNRELNLISSIITYAIKEWEIGLTENPVKLIRRPEKKESLGLKDGPIKKLLLYIRQLVLSMGINQPVQVTIFAMHCL